ncbi:hypothetical protein TREMEDRAFT_74647 [Tremella mesenterica DSM 1558]|uniref:uncharacterized protein n=1 Tax=Tremella mesenterica (strain ATCC 24925 / CBS 8224 / DSM 1558 / NBRC 9311 / NRRL Y-6157 / RJB 2259-6 / UBC 559-6) TaxID=578456 RepID=UPI0003F4A1C9|nr:uncharacterized protein TREMEDRAFT_74647 [Tremella mesenterica DSM 1558]EIW67114.1 hypothetical protein TREMEDRAFT_74647 [Tremella mesenterica DSM 1558]
MSLYADEDLSAVQDIDTKTLPTIPHDPLQALAAALTCPPESPEQAEALIAAGQRFEEQPDRLPELCGQLLPMVVDGGESLLRSWTLDMVALAVGRSGLKVDVKLAVAQSSLDALNNMLLGGSIPTIKAVIPIFSTIYPMLFRLLATTRPPQQIYDIFLASKSRILAFALDPNIQPRNVGIKARAWKFLQRVLLAGTRAASADPRLQNKAGGNDPSVSMITRESPLNIMEMEDEANLLRTQLVTHMYSSDDPAILQPLFNTLPLLCKSRPTLAALLVSSMTSWTPAALEAAGRPAMQIRAVEKTMRLAMTHVVRQPSLTQFSAQLNDALLRQKLRMDSAFSHENVQRKAKREAIKRGMVVPVAESSEQAVKRVKLEIQPGSGSGKGPEFDVTTLPLETVIDAVMEGLGLVTEAVLETAFKNARQALLDNTADAMPVLGPSLNGEGLKAEVKGEERDEILNPLDMDVDDEDFLLQHAQEDQENVTFADITLPPPEIGSIPEIEDLVNLTLERIWSSGAELASLPDLEPQDGAKIAVQPKEMWMLLLARLATRGPDVKRKAIADFVSANFSDRSKFAAIWLNEEWYSQKLNGSGEYTINLETVLQACLATLDVKDKSLSNFLTSLPEIPLSAVHMLERLCEDVERSVPGLLALRDLVETRPPIRDPSLRTLLELCTHPERKTRFLAISTVRRWVPHSPMSDKVVSFAMGVYRRLVPTPKIQQGDDVEMEDGEQPDEEVYSKFLVETSKESVQQHLELVFALTKRREDLLDDIFSLYPKMESEIQDAVEAEISRLVQSMGATEKLLEVLRNFPQGAEKLALRVMTILSGEGSSQVLVTVVKGLMVERNLDPRFIIPVLGQLDKAEIEKQIPRIVTLLEEPDTRELVKTAFVSVLQKMTPADLLVALHSEETGLKVTIEAVGICFSLTTVFRSDVLATALQRICDLSSLPVIFLRTIIQAVTTYKSLVPFVANTVLPKLVLKRVWEVPQLWDGFMRLARLLGPASYGALVQLGRDQLREVVERQPALKTGLRTFLSGRPGGKAAWVEMFGEE